MPIVRIRLQDKQKEFLRSVEQYPVTFFGGAKGGGKSYGLRNILLILCSKYEKAKALLVRKTYDELKANHIDQLFRENPALEQYYNRSDRMLILPNGSTLRFRHLGHVNDVYNYQGQEFDFIGMDEITQHPKESFTILRSSNRTTNPLIKPRFILTGNPGGIGHEWVKKLFINKIYEPNENPSDYNFVSSRVYDNAELVNNDPDYIRRLEALPENLRKAYLEGNWDLFEGQFFQEFNRDIHVIKPFELYPQWKRFISLDYGYNKPTSVHWYAVDYNGRVIVYRELYSSKLTYKTLGEEILRLTPSEVFLNNGTTYNERKNIKYLTYDPALEIRSNESGVSGIDLIRQGMGDLKCGLIPANNNRKYGWGVMRDFLKPRPGQDGKMTAGIVWFETCVNAIRTIPSLIYDSIQLEDLDTDGEDHAADETRYGLVSINITPSDPDATVKKEQSSAEKNFYARMRKIKNRSIIKGSKKYEYV